MANFFRAAGLALLMLFAGPSGIGAQEHDGWSTDPLIATATELLGSENFREQAGVELPSMLLLDPTEEASCFVGPEDRIRTFVAGDFSSMLLIGNETSIHTLWFYFPILNVSDTDAAFAFYDGLLTHLFPTWSGADGWALQSLQRAWEAGAAAFQDPTISLDAMIARDSHAGARLAGWGVPPDIMTYRITARAHCEKVSAELLASPRRVPRVEAQRDRTQESAQLLLNYLHPQPLDLSETPIYLGPLSGWRSNRSSDDTVRLEATGYLADQLLELDPWIEKQASSFASTQDFLAEGWGYEPHFLLLIQDPLLWIEHDGGRYRALIDHLSVDVAGSIDGPYSYLPSSLRGILFATSAPVRATPEQRLDPPYMNLNEGRIGYGVEGRAAAVDISATPLHIGELSGVDGTLRLPSPLEGAIEGLVITLRDPATNQSARLDLTPWLARQTGTAPAPNRLTSISDPVIDFLLGSRRYRLVVETATFNEVSGTAQSIDLFAGRLFAQP